MAIPPAARSFYRAFYRWSVLNRSYHVTGRRRFDAQADEQWTVWPKKQTFDVRPQAVEETPSTSLCAYEGTVRYKAGKDVVYECALPEDRAQVLLARYDPDLERLSRNEVAHIEMGKVHSEKGEPLRLIRVLGTTAATIKAFDILHFIRSDRKFAQYEAGGKPRVLSYEEKPSSSIGKWEIVVRQHSDQGWTDIVEVGVSADIAPSIVITSGAEVEISHHDGDICTITLRGRRLQVWNGVRTILDFKIKRPTPRDELNFPSRLKRHIYQLVNLHRVKRQADLVDIRVYDVPERPGQCYLKLYGTPSAIVEGRILARELIRDAEARLQHTGPQAQFSLHLTNTPDQAAALGYLVGANGDTVRRLEAQTHYTITIARRGSITLAGPSASDKILTATQKIQTKLREIRPDAIVHARAQPSLPEAVRTAVRPLTHPVVVITSGERTEPRGMTASSFTSVCLQPEPRVSFNVKLPSRTWDAIVAKKRICIHLLAATEKAAELAAVFTKPHGVPREAFDHVKRLGFGVDVDDGPPEVYGAGVMARLRCTVDLLKCVSVGDHVIVVAKVEGVDHAEEGAKGLGYANGKYRVMGEELKLPDTRESRKLQSAISKILYTDSRG